MSLMSRRASGISARPAAVSVMARRERSNNRTPSSDSSAWICVLSGGCAMRRRSAARVKLSSSATARKY